MPGDLWSKLGKKQSKAAGLRISVQCLSITGDVAEPATCGIQLALKNVFDKPIADILINRAEAAKDGTNITAIGRHLLQRPEGVDVIPFTPNERDRARRLVRYARAMRCQVLGLGNPHPWVPANNPNLAQPGECVS